WSKQVVAAVDPQLPGDGAVHNGQHRRTALTRRRTDEVERGVQHGLGRGQHHRHILGLAPGHHGVRHDLGYGDLPAPFWRDTQHLVRGTPRIVQESLDALDGGRHDGQAVRPAEFITLFNRLGDVIPFHLPDVLKLHVASPPRLYVCSVSYI